VTTARECQSSGGRRLCLWIYSIVLLQDFRKWECWPNRCERHVGNSLLLSSKSKARNAPSKFRFLISIVQTGNSNLNPRFQISNAMDRSVAHRRPVSTHRHRRFSGKCGDDGRSGECASCSVPLRAAIGAAKHLSGARPSKYIITTPGRPTRRRPYSHRRHRGSTLLDKRLHRTPLYGDRMKIGVQHSGGLWGLAATIIRHGKEA
jgi:hypothetical protein